MFSFHKNEALSRSRQSSIDSSALDISTPPSSADAWGSQVFEPRPGQDQHSPEQRRRVQTGKRNSVFTLRSRSNTANSTLSSYTPLSPRMTNESGLALESPSLGQGPTQSYFEQHGQRRSMFRGRMGKRLSESLASGAGADELQESDAGKKRGSFLRKARRGTVDSDDPNHMKQRISNPFDFQHLSHTNRHNVAALEQGYETSLSTQWADRTSRRSNRSSGGDASYFQQNLSADNLGLPDSASNSGSTYTSPFSSPNIPSEMHQSDTIVQAPPSRPGLRLTRSVESFSQPGGAPRHRHSQSTTTHLRATSVAPLAPIDDIPEEDAEKHRQSIHLKRQSGVWDSFAPALTDNLPGHALTTPDDTAIHTPMIPFSPSLEDVAEAEEPDRFVSPRPAPPPPRNRAPTSPLSPWSESFSFNNPRSAAPQTRNRGNSHASHTSPKTAGLKRDAATPRPTSQMSDTLGSPTRRRTSTVAKPTTRNTGSWSVMEESWEDNVDYIYENALEADCDFDWDYVSDKEPCSAQHKALERVVNEAKPKKMHSKPTFELRIPSSGDFRTSLLMPMASDIPDLAAPSTKSPSTAGLSLQTPFLQTPFHEGEGFMLSPSLLVPNHYKDTVETDYEDILKEYDGSDCHFPIIDSHQSANSSARSSRVRFSRRSSYDSSLMSSAQSSGLLNSPMRRSASSSGSLPELVYSRQTRREFGIVVDELSEQIASLESLDRELEDDEVTPEPAPAAPAPEEPKYETFHKGHAPRDSTDFTTQLLSRHHHARSDGTAQLLSSVSNTDKPTKTRTHTRNNTAQAAPPRRLSLFPSAPKRTTPSAAPSVLSR